MSMVMRKGETLRTYSDGYWEMFNEIDGNFDDVAIRTFKKSSIASSGEGRTGCFPQEKR